MTPRLEVVAVDGPYSWTWRLVDETGEVLVEQPVRIDVADPSLAIAKDLYRNLWRIEEDPRQRFLARVGDFVSRRVLGDVGHALSELAPVTVRVSVPRAAMHLLALPFELAPLSGVTFCYDPGGARRPAAQTGTPRVLAIFSLPAESSALALARERRALDAQFAGYGESVELRTLQYGATRRAVANALAEEPGWDIVHIAGHGRAGQIFLENDDDTRDRVTAAEFVDLLARVPRRPGLVVLSTCESGAARVLRRRRERLGGVSRDLLDLARGEPGGSTENLGYEVASRIGCAVLAMRYPVDDDFSVALSQRLYAGLLVDGLPIDEVLRSAIPPAAAGRAALSAATPMLFGDPSFRLAPGRPAASVRPVRLPGAAVPPPPELFVGRTAILTRLLRPSTVATVLVGMPGVGKTACMAEAVALHRRQGREVVWHEVHADETSEELFGALGDAVGDTDVLIALDNIDAAPHLADVLAALIAPAARARFIMTSRRPVGALRSADHVVVPLLSRTESELLDRQLDELRWTDTGRRAPETSHARSWLICRGHPALIHHTGTGSDEARAWEVFTPVPSGRPILPTDHPGAAIQAWALGQSAMLPAAPRLLWQFLSALEVADRREELVTQLWPLVCAERGVRTQPLAATYDLLTRHGLAQNWDRGRYLLHPAVARAGRDADSDTHDLVVGLMAAVWENRYEQWTQDDNSEDALAHAAASSVPYLLRLSRWEHASTRCEEAINHDRSPDMAARLLPFLNEIVRAEPDPRRRRASRYVRATVLVDLHPQRAEEELERIHAEAADDHDAPTQLAAAISLAGLLTQRDPQEAAEWIRRASQGDGVDLSTIPLVRLKLAKIAQQLGDNALAREEATAVLEDLDRPGEHDEVRTNRNAVRVEAMELIAAAAANLGDQEQERTLREQIAHELARHGAGERARVMAQFNQLANQLASGAQLDAITDLLLAARSEFLNPADQAELALVLVALAKLERRRRNHTEAVDLAYQALRSTYAAGEVPSAATVHEDLAALLSCLQPIPDDEIGVHLLAAAVIRLRAAGLMLALRPPPDLMRSLAMLSFRLARRSHDLPRSYDDLRDALGARAGVDLHNLLVGTERIPIKVDPESGNPVLQYGSDGSGDSVQDALLWASNWPRPAELLDPESHPEHWREVIDLFAKGTASAERVEEVLDRFRAAGWHPLADALAALTRGEEVNGDLDATDRALLRMVRAAGQAAGG